MASPILTRLLDHSKDSRKLRTYAYLTASFASRNDVSDILDCLLPFLGQGAAEQQRDPIDLSKLAEFLQSLGLRIPLYTLEALMPRLAKAGAIEWSPIARRYFFKQTAHSLEARLVDGPVFDESFDYIEKRLTEFAANQGVAKPPFSENWSDALTTFLKSESASDAMRTATIKGTIVGDSKQVESFLIASFIRSLENANRTAFDAIVQVYTGVLIEQFINDVQSIGDTSKYNNLNIFYDTTVILRLLGTSGKLFQTATIEMHRTLQDLGCKTYYLEYTEAEVASIISTLISAHAAGNELFGETAEAILDGEVSIALLKDLEGTFPDRLGEANIFPFPYSYNSRKQEDSFQIDEPSLASELEAAALRRDRTYKRQSAMNDARVVAVVLRLRRGHAKRDINSCNYLFISRNQLLQWVARKFVLNTVEEYDERTVPPVLTVGQITTVAWLASSKTLEPAKVSRGLLANCYNAVRPSSAWTEEFARALDRFKAENAEIVEQRANSLIFLQTARNAARDESLGQVALLKKVNVAALFAKAAEEAAAHGEKIQQVEADAARATEETRRDVQELLRRAAEDEMERERETARETEARLTEVAAAAELRGRTIGHQENVVSTLDRILRISSGIAKAIRITVQIFLALLFVVLLRYQTREPVQTAQGWLLPVAVGIIDLLSILHLLGIEWISSLFKRWEFKLTSMISWLIANLVISTPGGLGPTRIKTRDEPRLNRPPS